MNPLHTWMLCANFGWNWPSSSGVDFQNSSMHICYFVKNFENKTAAFHLNLLESPSSKDALCLVWLKFAKLFWRRWCLNFLIIFSWERTYSFILNKLDSFLSRVHCAELIWNWSWKVNSQTDDRRSKKPSWAFSSEELKNSHKIKE